MSDLWTEGFVHLGVHIVDAGAHGRSMRGELLPLAMSTNVNVKLLYGRYVHPLSNKIMPKGLTALSSAVLLCNCHAADLRYLLHVCIYRAVHVHVISHSGPSSHDPATVRALHDDLDLGFVFLRKEKHLKQCLSSW